MSLTDRRLVSMWSVSNMIPRNDSNAEGLFSLSDANGTPKSTHRDTEMSRLNTANVDAPIVR